MNFFKRKFSFQDDEGEISLEDPGGQNGAAHGSAAPASAAPPSAFSFNAIANRVSNTISAPTSPARSGESLAAAFERSLQADHRRAGHAPIMHPDARILLVIDSHLVDWSKYFRNPAEPPIRVEQADFPELDIMCTEHSCTVEIRQMGRDPRSFSPNAVFIGPGATRSPLSKTLLRALVAAHLPFINSHTSIVAFMDRMNLKKQLRKITLPDGSRIPFLPTIHYPHFHRFHPSTSFPVVISVNEGYQGIGKMKVSNQEELCDVEGLLQIMGRGDTEVEVEPFVDIKYDLHVQRIGGEVKTFIRRGISRNWKSNVGSAVMEQIATTEKHKSYIRAIGEHVGHMNVCSIDILVSKEGREFVHDVNDVIAYFGESQEDDRRAVCALLKTMVYPRKKSQDDVPREVRNGHAPHPPRPIPRGVSSERVQEPRERRQSREMDTSTTTTFADDTMGQLKRTFAGIFGET